MQLVVSHLVHRFLPEEEGGRAVAAEIITHDGQDYAAWFDVPNSVENVDKGIMMARLKWVAKTPQEILKWKVDNYPKYRLRTPVERAMTPEGCSSRQTAARSKRAGIVSVLFMCASLDPGLHEHEPRNVDRFHSYQGQVRSAHFAGKYFCMA